MLIQNKLHVHIFLFCALNCFYLIYREVQHLNSILSVETLSGIYSLPDINFRVPLNKDSLTITNETRSSGLKIKSLISNFTIAQIRQKLNPQLFSVKVYLMNTLATNKRTKPNCSIIHYINGFRIYIKVTCSDLESHSDSILVIEHNLPSYSLMFSEKRAFDGAFAVYGEKGIYGVYGASYAPLVMYPLTTVHYESVFDVREIVTIYSKPPEGPGYLDYTIDDYNRCKIKTAFNFGNKTLDLNTIVELNDPEFDDYRYINYVDPDTNKPGLVGGCADPFVSKTKYRDVQFSRAGITEVLRSHTPKSMLKFRVDRSGYEIYYKYSKTLIDYVWEILEIASFWLGFSVFSIASALAKIIQKLYIKAKLKCGQYYLNKIVPERST